MSRYLLSEWGPRLNVDSSVGISFSGSQVSLHPLGCGLIQNDCLRWGIR
ncbi:unnamed protein product [Rhodiola kirilowii]